MDWLCSTCSRSFRDHTVRELDNGLCTYTPPPPPAWAGLTAGSGKINPEVLDHTGEEFDFSRWNRRPQIEEP